MSTSCGACGKVMRYTQSLTTCSGVGCKAMAHYGCVANTIGQEWRCVACCYPTENSVQYLLGEILKKGSGLELLQGLIGKINDLVTEINKIRNENETLRQGITLLTNNNGKVININTTNCSSSGISTSAATGGNDVHIKKPSLSSNSTVNKKFTKISTTNNDSIINGQQSTSTLFCEPVYEQKISNKKISIFVTSLNTNLNETFLQQYLQNTTQIKSIDCIRVSCYNTYSMFQIKVDQNDAHLLANTKVYPEGCKLEIFGR